MTKITFIAATALYFAATALFTLALYTDGHGVLALAIGSLATVSWCCVKIAIEAKAARVRTLTPNSEFLIPEF
jgi:hypothetical protein